MSKLFIKLCDGHIKALNFKFVNGVIDFGQLMELECIEK